MTQRGTLDISRRRTVCVRDAWADRTGRKVSGSAALQCSCRPSYCAGPARASGAGIPTRRATCPSPWAVLVCHCWKKKEEHRRASQAWKEYCQKIPAHSERMDLTDPFFFHLSVLVPSVSERKNLRQNLLSQLQILVCSAKQKKNFFCAKIQTISNQNYFEKASQHHGVR